MKKPELKTRVNITLEEWQWAQILFFIADRKNQMDDITMLAYKGFATEFMKRSVLAKHIREDKGNGKH